MFIQKNDVFTTSKIISKGANVDHKSIKKLIRKYKSDLEEFGTLMVLNLESTGGRPEKVYELNKEQTMLLISVLNCPISAKKHIIKNVDKDKLPTIGIKENKKGYVYILEWANNLVKIGRTKKPYKRIDALRTQSPIELKQTYISEEIPNYEEVELKLHDFFSKSRKHGEYFTITFEKAVKKLKEISKT
nr:MAG TPA: hypothetical protein [Caudoviricetes sp.]